MNLIDIVVVVFIVNEGIIGSIMLVLLVSYMLLLLVHGYCLHRVIISYMVILVHGHYLIYHSY